MSVSPTLNCHNVKWHKVERRPVAQYAVAQACVTTLGRAFREFRNIRLALSPPLITDDETELQAQCQRSGTESGPGTCPLSLAISVPTHF